MWLGRVEVPEPRVSHEVNSVEFMTENEKHTECILGKDQCEQFYILEIIETPSKKEIKSRIVLKTMELFSFGANEGMSTASYIYNKRNGKRLTDKSPFIIENWKKILGDVVEIKEDVYTTITGRFEKYHEWMRKKITVPMKDQNKTDLLFFWKKCNPSLGTKGYSETPVFLSLPIFNYKNIKKYLPELIPKEKSMEVEDETHNPVFDEDSDNEISHAA